MAAFDMNGTPVDVGDIMVFSDHYTGTQILLVEGVNDDVVSGTLLAGSDDPNGDGDGEGMYLVDVDPEEGEVDETGEHSVL